jgi:hypothetical protein
VDQTEDKGVLTQFSLDGGEGGHGGSNPDGCSSFPAVGAGKTGSGNEGGGGGELRRGREERWRGNDVGLLVSKGERERGMGQSDPVVKTEGRKGGPNGDWSTATRHAWEGVSR